MAYFRPNIIDGNISPAHPAIATRGYKVGYFSPGPPRLQTYQGSRFSLVYMILLVSNLVIAWPAISMVYHGVLPLAMLVPAVMPQMALLTVFYWFWGLFDDHRELNEVLDY
ncbi:hypothetical protein F4804DRAFT_333650 [Jackrogersella minutella]|nr:hypothetical protein F4804DRAFT_333650 [Jackrogersella minutella]